MDFANENQQLNTCSEKCWIAEKYENYTQRI